MFNKLTADNLASRLKQVNLATTGDIADFVKNSDLNKKTCNIVKKIRIKSSIAAFN